MTILQRELSCHQYLPSYEPFFIQKLHPKMCSKTLTSRHFLEVRCEPTATATPLRPTSNKCSVETVEDGASMLQATLSTLRSSFFSKHEKSVIFGFYSNGGHHENILESSIFRNG